MDTIVVSGNANIDYYYFVEYIPGPDEAVEAFNVTYTLGGAATNVCVALAKLGNRVRFLGYIGNDSDGELILKKLSTYKVDTSFIKKSSKPTGKVVIILDKDGQRAMIAIRGANRDLKPGVFDKSSLENSIHLHLSSTKPKYSEWLLGIAKDVGLTTSYDPGMTVASLGIEKLRSALRNVDVLFLNERELEALGGIGNVKKYMGNKQLVLKLGEMGSRLLPEDIYVPAFKVKVKDTTGAGDCFDAAFITCWLKGYEADLCLIFANAAAALKIQNLGAHSSPTLKEVFAFLKEKEKKEVVYRLRNMLDYLER